MSNMSKKKKNSVGTQIASEHVKLISKLNEESNKKAKKSFFPANDIVDNECIIDMEF